MPYKYPRSPEAKASRNRAMRAWSAKYPARSRAHVNKSRAKYAEKYRAAARRKRPTRKSRPEIRASWILQSARLRAKKRGMEFDLDNEAVAAILRAGTCEATGLSFDLASKKRSPYSPSLDRIDNTRGYTTDNVRVVLWAFNAACGDWGEAVLKKIVTSRWPGLLPNA